MVFFYFYFAKFTMYIMRDITLKEELKMEVWEIAVAIIAITYLFVSVASMGIMIRFMSKFDGLFDKYVKFAEKELEEADEDL